MVAVFRFSMLLGLVGLVAACGPSANESFESLRFEPLQPPVGAGSMGPSVATAPSGSADAAVGVILSWMEPGDAGVTTLRFSVLDGSGEWSAAHSVASGPDWFVNWADFPAIVAHRDGLWCAHWLQKSGTGTYAYDVKLSLSRDHGQSWSPSFSPHRDWTQTEHGFVSVIPWSEQDFLAVWLDGRNTAASGSGHDASPSDTAAHSSAEQQAAMTMRSAVIAADGSLSSEHLIDDRVCDCCQTSLAGAGGAALVAYRDRTDEELRDISLARYDGSGWSRAMPVRPDGWVIEGCPVNGPAISAGAEASLEEGAFVAWFTGADAESRVYARYLASDGTAKSPPVRIDDGSPLGRVDVATLADGGVAVCWMESTSDGADVRVRRMGSDGRLSRSLTVATVGGSRTSGFPRIASTRERLVVVWTAVESGTPRVAGAAAILPRP